MLVNDWGSDWENIGYLTNNLADALDDFGEGVADLAEFYLTQPTEEVAYAGSDLANKVGSWVKGEIINNTEVVQNFDDVSFAQKIETESNTNSAVVGVSAALVGAFAALAAFTACRKRKEINANEEAFLRA